MNPFVGEVYLHAVHIIHRGLGLSLIHLLNLQQDSVHIRAWSKVNAVFGNEIVRIFLSQFAYFQALMRQVTQEERYTYQGVTAIVALGIDDTTISLATNHGIDSLHLGSHIYLSHRSRRINAAMFLRNITKRTGRTQVADGVSGRMLQHIIGHTHKRVLLAKHLSVLTDECQSVNIGVYHDTQIITAFGQLAHDTAQILLQWFRIMGKIAIRFAIKESIIHAKFIEQFRQDNTSNGVNAVDNHVKPCLPNSLHIHQFQSQNGLNMAFVERIIIGIFAQMVHIRIIEIFLLGYRQHLVTVISGQEFTLTVEQFQGIPVAWIVAGRNNDTAIGPTHLDSQLGCRRCGQPYVNDIIAHSHKCSTDNVLHHVAGNTGITAYDNLIGWILGASPNKSGVSSSKLYNIQRVQGITRLTTDGTTNTRN